MRAFILIFVSMFTILTWADTETNDFPDSPWGHFRMSVEPIADRAVNPYHFKITAICKDQRDGEHQLGPPKEQPLLFEGEENDGGIYICDFIMHKYDENSLKLEVKFLQHGEGRKPGSCDVLSKPVFDLKTICAAWAQ